MKDKIDEAAKALFTKENIEIHTLEELEKILEQHIEELTKEKYKEQAIVKRDGSAFKTF